ncbi:MAG TPA: hypothetical protein VGF04_06230 [Solirubrobacterales bacterium]|jgi:hypothetical protein
MLEVVLAGVPLLLLLALLLAGFYPGCETIVRLAERRGRRPGPSSTRATSRPRPAAPLRQAVSGGLLIAFGHPQRPPPLAA